MGTLSATELNHEQRAAVEHAGGPALVLAGPGTGKTRVLISRLTHLVGKEKVDPQRILALTFSRRAAEEMSERITASAPRAAEVEVRTFHSFALRLVRRHYARLGMGAPPEILPTAQQWALVSELLSNEDPRQWGLAPGAFEKPSNTREVYDLLLRAREHLLEPEDLRRLAAEHNLPYLNRAAVVLEGFRLRLEELGQLDYEAVIRQAIRLLREGDLPGAMGRYGHVLVDEFQDTNRSQLELVKLLAAGDHPEVFCVGDDFQSIYGFRGAAIDNIRRFEEHFPGATRLHLSTNHRCSGPVVSLAEAIVEPRRGGRPPQRVSSARAGAVFHHVAASAKEEAEWVAGRILELNRADGVPFEQIAILRRSLRDAGPLLNTLAARGIPVDLSQDPVSTLSRHFATLLGATEGEEPSPEAAGRALVCPLCGASPATARALRESAAASGRSVFALISSGDGVGGVPEEEMERARAVVEAVRGASAEEGFLAKLNVLWKQLPGVREMVERHRRAPDAARALLEASAFLRSAQAYATASHHPTVEGFLRGVRPLHDDSDTWAPATLPAQATVRVMTVHASKGLEFEAVFVTGLTEDRFPVRGRGAKLADRRLAESGRPLSSDERQEQHLDEERRLLYVAATRAKTTLYLTGVEEASEEGVKASSFLRELEGHLIGLQIPQPARRFWRSRREAAEELRRVACDAGQPPATRFAAVTALREDLGEDPAAWWRYLQPTQGTPEPPERRASAAEISAHISCPRRAFLKRLVPGRPGGGKQLFGAAFKEGLSRYLAGESLSLETAVEAAIAARDFGGPALDDYWRRTGHQTVRECAQWANELKETLLQTGPEETQLDGWTLSAGRDPVVDIEGRRTLVRVSTSRYPPTKAEAATDPAPGVAAVLAGARRARLVYPRKPLAGGQPTTRETGEEVNWEEELHNALSELEAGLVEARPQERRCSGCEFISTCPAHPRGEPWR